MQFSADERGTRCRTTVFHQHFRKYMAKKIDPRLPEGELGLGLMDACLRRHDRKVKHVCYSVVASIEIVNGRFDKLKTSRLQIAWNALAEVQ